MTINKLLKRFTLESIASLFTVRFGPWGLLIQGVANTISAGVVYAAGKKLQKAYQEYADELKNLANEYSGEKANQKLTAAGEEQANISNQRALNEAVLENGPKTGANTTAMGQATQNAENVSNANSYEEGYNLGAQNKQTLMQGQYNYAKNIADAKKEQAEKEYQAKMAAAGGIQKIGSTVSTLGLTGSSGGGTTAQGGSGTTNSSNGGK